MTYEIKAALGALLMMAGAVAWAEPVVICDSGRSESIEAYVPRPKPQPKAFKPKPDALIASLLDRRFPVHTPELTPGKVAPRASAFSGLTQPVFLVGSDDLSRRWLRQFGDKLRAAGAVGLVVEAQSLVEFQELAALAPALRLVPVSGSDLVRQLAPTVRLEHYPLLISARRIEQ